MDPQILKNEILSEIDNTLKETVAVHLPADYPDFIEMITYHMGWTGYGAGSQAQGKRIRPLLLLLITGACGGNWHTALPAAAAVEILHNYTLIHDDIQDQSATRHGRPTLWKQYGIPQAINTGDALFSLAELTLANLEKSYSLKQTHQAAKLLNKASLRLTHGQYLDIAFESENNITLDAYMEMIKHKTAALISACTEIGAVLGSNNSKTRRHAVDFGENLGLAFEILDDYLGIWGNPDTIGKSVENDLVSHKKSLPILYGIMKKGEFFDCWSKGAINEVKNYSRILIKEGAQDYTRQMADDFTKRALDALGLLTTNKNKFAAELEDLTNKLLTRDK